MFKFATSLSRSLFYGCFRRKVHPVEDETDYDEIIVPVHGTPFQTFDGDYILEISLYEVLYDHRYRSDMIVKRIPVGISDSDFERMFEALSLYLTPDVELMIRWMTEKGYYDESLISELMDDVSMQSRGFRRDECACPPRACSTTWPESC
jgi:hypothetical protein